MTDDALRNLLSERLAAIRSRIARACERAGRYPAGVTFIAVTKSVSTRVAVLLPGLGIPDLGENRPQELGKKAAVVTGARWHLIGHLQRNKIDRTVPLVALIHSIDSERVLEAVDHFGRKRSAPVPVLLEVNCSREDNKGGFRPEEVPALADRLIPLTGVRIEGLMTMAAYADKPRACRPTFAELRALRDEMRTRTGLLLPHLSMGMSNDFETAVEEGSTFVRIGTALFDGLGGE